MKVYIPIFFALALLSSCASSYNLIKPERVNYQTNLTEQDVDFSYKYGVLLERGNKKYAKKEAAKGIKVVAVKVTNNSDQSFVLGQDLKIHSNGNSVNILDPKTIQQNLKQGSPYLLALFVAYSYAVIHWRDQQ